MDAHPSGDGGTLIVTRTVDPPGLRLEGELDAARHGELSEALTALTALHGTGGEVRLDLAGLYFIDLGSLSLLSGFGNGRRVVLDGLSPTVARVIETLGWERLPGLVRGTEATS
ncbi:STAS domain-containing protein [Streptomyces sp. NPDC058739]|uniref:STAS domain-containing protein n=1 Tax=Streptomyces sp. NPDC058739 TaxID=3346618 RepID=UPI0036BA16A5